MDTPTIEMIFLVSKKKACKEDLGHGPEMLGERKKSDTICVFGNIYCIIGCLGPKRKIIEQRRATRVFDQLEPNEEPSDVRPS